MAANHNDNTILGNILGQGCVNAVRGWQTVTAFAAKALEACGLFTFRGSRYALIKRTPAQAMSPISATCRTSDRRHQRHQRWMSGVVVDPGTVGVG